MVEREGEEGCVGEIVMYAAIYTERSKEREREADRERKRETDKIEIEEDGQVYR